MPAGPRRTGSRRRRRSACSCMSAIVVHAVPRPRARAASMKLHVPGSTLPIIDAAIIDGTLSTRPPVQAITSAGASPMWSARYSGRLGDAVLLRLLGFGVLLRSTRRTHRPWSCRSRSTGGRSRRSPCAWPRPSRRRTASSGCSSRTATAWPMATHSRITSSSTGPVEVETLANRPRRVEHFVGREIEQRHGATVEVGRVATPPHHLRKLRRHVAYSAT